MPDTEQIRVKIMRRLASSQRSDLFSVELMSGASEKVCASMEMFSDAGFGSGGVLSELSTLAKLVNSVEAYGVSEVFEILDLVGRVGVVMEPLDGVSVQGLTGEVLPPEAAIELVGSVAMTLQEMLTKAPENGQTALSMRHGSLSASSVVISTSGQVSVIGFVKDKKANLIRSGSTLNFAMGPLDYMAPEQRFAEYEGASADIYALGSLLYRLLTGRSLGQSGASEAAHLAICRKRLLNIENVCLDSRVSQELSELMAQMLAFQRTMRPSAKLVANRLKMLSTQMEGEDLIAWAAQAVPRLNQKSLPPQKSARVDLVGTILKCSHSIKVVAESAPPFGRDESEADDTQEQEVTVPQTKEDHPVGPLPVPTDERSLADQSTSIAALRNDSEAEECFAIAKGTAPPVESQAKDRAGLVPALALIASILVPLAGVLGVGLGVAATFGAASMGFVSLDNDLAAPDRMARTPELRKATPPRGRMQKSRSESRQKQLGRENARFVSKFTNTQRMVIRCDTGEAKARGNELTYDISGAQRCTVSAIDGKRKRTQTIVKNLEPRIYSCFENGESSCE